MVEEYSTDNLTTLIMKSWPPRGFLAGVALSAPFVADAFPTWVAPLFVLPLLVDILLRGVRLRPFFHLTPIVLIMGALATLHLGALAMGTTPFVSDVIGNLIRCGGAVGIVLLASDPEDSPEMMIKGFLAALAITAVPIALAGLVKYALQLHGILFGSLINSCFGRYPQGTTFCGDYNLFGLYLGGAAIGVSTFMLQSKGKARWTILFILGVSLSIILAAGLFAGSRRFAALAFLVAVYWGANLVFSPARTIRAGIIPLLLTITLSLYLAAPRDKIADENAVTVEQIVAPWIGALQPLSPQEIVKTRTSTNEAGNSKVLAARDISPAALASTFDDNYGFGSRIEKLKLGWRMVQEKGYLLGSGFRYHEIFSCKFVACEFIDYPHAPILSAWVAFGVVGLILALAFYGVTGVNILLAGKVGILSGASLMAVAVMPFSLLSGDTIFSLPHTLIGALLVANEASRARRVPG